MRFCYEMPCRDPLQNNTHAILSRGDVQSRCTTIPVDPKIALTAIQSTVLLPAAPCHSMPRHNGDAEHIFELRRSWSCYRMGKRSVDALTANTQNPKCKSRALPKTALTTRNVPFASSYVVGHALDPRGIEHQLRVRSTKLLIPLRPHVS